MAELVFYDQRLPLKRKWSEGSMPLQSMVSPPLHPQRLPRLPSLSTWTNVPSSTATIQPSTLAVPTASVSPVAAPLTLSPSPSPESTASESTKPTAPMRNTSRERMKAEQASLRAQATALETELACLRQLRHERLAACLRESSSEPATDGLVGWQDMAQRHWDQRVASERENKRLREAVNGLATEVKSLEALFHSRSSALMASFKQNAQLSVQLQELLGTSASVPQPSPRRHVRSVPTSKSKKQHAAATAPQQQSPRDVACAMEAPQSPYGL